MLISAITRRHSLLSRPTGDSGAVMAEYGVLLAMVALGGIVAVAAFGQELVAVFPTMTDSIEGVGGSGSTGDSAGLSVSSDSSTSIGSDTPIGTVADSSNSNGNNRGGSNNGNNRGGSNNGNNRGGSNNGNNRGGSNNGNNRGGNNNGNNRGGNNNGNSRG